MKDILKSISIRLNNPFIISFAISWLFWNWPITIGLIWYNANNIESLGYSDYSDLISSNASYFRNYIAPFLSALVFVVGLPIIRLISNYVQTWFDTKDEANIKKLSGKGFIPTTKFINLREEYETNIKNLSDIIENESNIYNENLKLSTAITEKDVEIGKLIADQEAADERYGKEIKNLQNRINESSNVINRFGLTKDGKLRILHATYGTTDKFNVVTELVNKKLSEEDALPVENDVLGGDPVPNFVKQLFLIYTFGEDIKTITVLEGSHLYKTDKELLPQETEISIKKQDHKENEDKLSKIFHGEWQLVYQHRNGKSGTERVIVDDQGNYFVNGQKHFHLGSITISPQSITFTKISLDGKKHSKETLTRERPDRISGSNDQGYQLVYTKL